ncbi:hypothetical protein AB0L40_11965 [Patulibacter sp. NPDC049589]|uniref:hypothetical protein n=1 Tax=Patulibacter sp. NPDC049589 TaxID=3154731 RepID=UPI00343B57A7
MLPDDLRRYADAAGEIIAREFQEHPVAGALDRVVVRWFWDGPPTYVTVHGLGLDDPAPDPFDAWSPLEWPNIAREDGRAERIWVAPEFVAASEGLAERFGRDEFGEVTVLEATEGEDHVPALIEGLRGLAGRLDALGVRRTPDLAVAVCHFEGWGWEDTLPQLNDPAVLSSLSARGLPLKELE